MNNDLKPNFGGDGNGLAIASLVLGILSLVGVWAPGFNILFAVIGLALGAVAQKQLSEAGAPHGIATAGIILNLIFLAVGIIATIVCVSCSTCVFCGTSCVKNLFGCR